METGISMAVFFAIVALNSALAVQQQYGKSGRESKKRPEKSENICDNPVRWIATGKKVWYDKRHR